MEESDIQALIDVADDDSLALAIEELLTRDEEPVLIEHLISSLDAEDLPQGGDFLNVACYVIEQQSRGDEPTVSLEDASKFFEYAKSKESSFACYYCGQNYLNGNVVKKSFIKALECFLEFQRKSDKNKELPFDLKASMRILFVEFLRRGDVQFKAGKFDEALENYIRCLKCNSGISRAEHESVFAKIKSIVGSNDNSRAKYVAKLQNFLEALYLKAYPVPQDPPLAVEDLELDKVPKPAQPGWTKKINGTLIDAFDAGTGKKADSRKKVVEREIQRQYAVQSHFFDPRRTRSQRTRDLAVELLNVRTAASDTVVSVEDVSCSRVVITAERSTTQIAKETLGLNAQGAGFGKGTENRNMLGWKKRGYASKEKVQLEGKVVVACAPNFSAYPNHMGNYFITIPHLGKAPYDVILAFFHKLTGSTKAKPDTPNEQKLVELMLGFSRTLKTIRFETLKAVFPKASKEDCETLNALCYHIFVKEMHRRMPCGEEKYDLPVVIIQARALKLIAKGKLTLAQVFDLNSDFGVVTPENIYFEHERVVEIMENVNRLYNEEILRVEFSEALAVFFAKNPGAEVVASRKQMKAELRELCGDNDTDGEGYSSSEESPKLQYKAPKGPRYARRK